MNFNLFLHVNETDSLPVCSLPETPPFVLTLKKLRICFYFKRRNRINQVQISPPVI